PNIIDLPKTSPKEITTELEAAFGLYWSNPAACAVRIRVALESLMNHLGVPKRTKAKHGRFNSLTLHSRIDNFASKDATIGPQLMALKWLGNTGSHDSTVSKSDLLDAFEILEYVLGELLDKRSEYVAALAKK